MHSKRHAQLRYAYEKFGNAVYQLATGRGDVKSRLREAFLEIHPVQVDHLPHDIRLEFDAIIHELTKREERFPGQGKLDATLHGMHRRTGADIANRIYELNGAIERLLNDET